MSAQPKLLVEGWRFLPHSYALVNQWQLLALARRGDVALSHRDKPYLYKHWKPTRGIFSPGDEEAIAAIGQARNDEEFDAVYRIDFPFDFRRGGEKRTAIFVTSEYQALPPSFLLGQPDFAALAQDQDLRIVTPSNWSAAAFRKIGFSDEQIFVVPHGVETNLFCPNAERRDAMRQELNLDGFVFLSNGAMTPNKGIDLLLRAFAIVAQKRPEARLLLKGHDPLYDSSSLLQKTIAALSAPEQKTILERLVFTGKSMDMSEIAGLYQAADAYVSPYRAEGFNIPVLEAAATGLPVICSGGGATDDFVAPSFAKKVTSSIESVEYSGLPGQQLVPNFDHLVELMLGAMDEDDWRRNAASAGPIHARENYHWDRIVEQLLAVVCPGD